MQRGDENLEIRLAENSTDIRAAQRLRYQVFVTEMGADGAFVDHDNQLEIDQYDTHSQQLILVDRRRSVEKLDHVVGVYRMLDRQGAVRAGGYYSQGEYDLTLLLDSNRTILELGRSCVHPDHRNGMALYLLWHGLGDYVRRKNIDVLFGVASFAGTELDKVAAPLNYLHEHHLAPPDLRVVSLNTPKIPKTEILDRAAVMAAMPALIKAYLRIGGFVGNGAFIDRGFNTTDVCMILDTDRMGKAARQRYGDRG